MSSEPTCPDAFHDFGAPVARFLRTLFSHVPPGFIESRGIEDRGDGALVDRAWYANADALIADLPRIAEEAQQRGIGLFFGVLPRRAYGTGTAADTLPGLVLWADVDFKDYAGGEDEARRRTAQFPSQPSIVVRSGHGLHLYWLLSEPTKPALIKRLNLRIARFLGADHAFDAARVLRLPGTWNVKDSAHPILVEIERMDDQ